MDPYIDLLKQILPETLIEYFDLIKSINKEGILHLYFEEKNVIPKEDNHRILIAHGFHKEISIQDFPLRGKTYYFTLNAVDGLKKHPIRSFNGIGI